MNSKEYQANALRTESIPKSLEIHEVSMHAILSLLIGAVKIADLVKRKLYYGKPIPNDALMDQINVVGTLAGFLLLCQEHDPVRINARILPDQHESVKQNLPDLAEMNLDNLNIRLLHCGLGMFTESGELLQALLKQYETGELDKVNFGEELGDSDWYKAIGQDETGVSEETTRAKNIAKLKARYPDKFSEVAALNRDLTAERAILEADVAAGYSTPQPSA